MSKAALTDAAWEAWEAREAKRAAQASWLEPMLDAEALVNIYFQALSSEAKHRVFLELGTKMIRADLSAADRVAVTIDQDDYHRIGVLVKNGLTESQLLAALGMIRMYGIPKPLDEEALGGEAIDKK